MSRCNGCGKTDHAGGCDLVEFYQWQRFGCVAAAQEMTPTPPPPTPLIDSDSRGVIEATPLSVQNDISTLSVQTVNLETIGGTPLTLTLAVDNSVVERGTSRRDTLKTVSKQTKPVDDPAVIKRREEIRIARVANMAKAREKRKSLKVAVG